jgi:CRP-like cAMP-binding protein
MSLPLLDILRSLSKDPTAGVLPGRSLRTRTGQALYFQGDPSDSVYVLASGEVQLSVSLGDDSQPQVTLLCQAPAVLGDRDLLLESPAREGARCLEPCDVLLFDGPAFKEEWSRTPALREWLSKDLAARYASSLELARLQHRSLAYRVAALWHDWQRRQTTGSAPPVRYLSEVWAVNEKSVLRGLAWLRKNGVLRTEGPHEVVVPETAQTLEVAEDLDKLRLFHRLVTE